MKCCNCGDQAVMDTFCVRRGKSMSKPFCLECWEWACEEANRMPNEPMITMSWSMEEVSDAHD